MSDLHQYRCRLSWRGSTGAGYEEYGRTHRIELPPALGELELSSDPAFLGTPALMNPEQLLVASASSCQLLSFLALAARARIDVLAYEDDAEAIMPEDEKPMRITAITLRPTITVAVGTDRDRTEKLVGRAHERCFIANTLNAQGRAGAADRGGSRLDRGDLGPEFPYRSRPADEVALRQIDPEVADQL